MAVGVKATLRRFINVAGYAPLPSDTMATPVTFRVRKRGLQGLLSESDASEDGRRSLSGEWIVSRALWKRLQAEWHESKGKRARRAVQRKDRVLLYVHGGELSRSSLVDR